MLIVFFNDSFFVPIKWRGSYSGRWTLQQYGVVAGASASALFCLSLVLGEKLRPYLKYFQPATQKICGARKCFEGYKGGPGLIWYPALAVLSPPTFLFLSTFILWCIFSISTIWSLAWLDIYFVFVPVPASWHLYEVRSTSCPSG